MPSPEACADETDRELRAEIDRLRTALRAIADALGNTAYTDPILSQTYMPPDDAIAARAIAAAGSDETYLRSEIARLQSQLDALTSRKKDVS